MASWLSSKLRVAEELLNQIDKQAAGSLRKQDQDSSQQEEFTPDYASSSHLDLYSSIPEQNDTNNKYHSQAYLQFNKPASGQYATRDRQDRAASSGKIGKDDWTEILASSDSASSVGGWKSNQKSTLHYGRTNAKIGRRSHQTGTISSAKQSKSQALETKRVLSEDSEQQLDFESNDSYDAATQKFSTYVSNDSASSITTKTETQEQMEPTIMDHYKEEQVRDDKFLQPHFQLHATQPLPSLNVGAADVHINEETHKFADELDSEGSHLKEGGSAADLSLKSQATISAFKAAIKEREVFLEKLEMEKEALERLLADREEQQTKEAADLRTGMVELMQAVELEKQRHNNTRKETLAREALLENQNAELAKALAASQRKLDRELTGLVDARTKIESKRVFVAELERKILKLRFVLAHPPQLQEEYVKRQHSSVSEEKTKIVSEIDNCKTQLKGLEGEILSAKGLEQLQTAKERELESRLAQLTDHLIQKQTQVEALSTEKATLIFRLEALSNAFQEARPSNGKKRSCKGSYDVELGASSCGDKEIDFVKWYNNLSSGVDNLFAGGARILGVTSTVRRAFAAAYLLALHGWVLFVILRHAHVGAE